MKLINLLKQSLVENLDELSPQARNYAAMVAASKPDDGLSRGKEQNIIFSKLPQNLQDKGKKIAELIKKETGAFEVEHKLEKIVNDPKHGERPYIDFKVVTVGGDRPNKDRYKMFSVKIERDKRELDNSNITISDDLKIIINKFVKDLQQELDIEFRKQN